MMKNFRKPRPEGIWKKVRSKTNTDIYYTYTSWDDHEVDGVGHDEATYPDTAAPTFRVVVIAAWHLGA
jgi:hypothetical protein